MVRAKGIAGKSLRASRSDKAIVSLNSEFTLSLDGLVNRSGNNSTLLPHFVNPAACLRQS
jgi:hypothetical protein